jgi:nucleotide-binding universal stress UspA family protein
MFRNLCVAVDLSEPSREALEQAADLARALGANLTVVHVVAPPPVVATDLLAAPGGVAEGAAHEDEEALETWRGDAEVRAGRPVRAHLLVGEPAKEIVRIAREEGCDLIVVGTHGRTGLRRVLLGSVAAAVVRAASCAVLVVHDGATRIARAEREEIAQYL